MSGLSDGFGEQPSVDSTIKAHERWLYATAYDLSPGQNVHIEDLVQEGRISMWHAIQTHDESLSPLSPWLYRHALRRMRHVAWKDGAPTGHTRQAGRPEVRPSTSIEAEAAHHSSEEGGSAHDVVAMLFGLVDTIDEIEIAYHHGEIMGALQALTPKQRAYVYARFWCGIDAPAGSRNEGVKQAKEQNPLMRRDVLWTGNRTTTGAKQRLAESLAHLRVLVAS